MASEKKIFLGFSHFKSMGANDPRGTAIFGPQGHGWQDLCRRPPNIATYLICGPPGFREEDSLIFFSSI